MSMTIRQLFRYAQLAQASYATLAWWMTEEEIQLALRERAFTISLAEDFSDTYQFIDQLPNTASGFSATVFREKDSGDYVLSIRGTEITSTADLATDFLDIGADGIAIDQAIDLFNLYQDLKAEIDSIVYHYAYDQSTGQVTYTSMIALSTGALFGKNFSVTGHSLGGHLALIMSRLAPDRVTAAYTFNPPGFDAFGSSPGSQAFFEALRQAEVAATGTSNIGTSFDVTRITNVAVPDDVVHFIGNVPGGFLPQFTEGGNALSNHLIPGITDSLAAYELLEILDPSRSSSEILTLGGDIFKASSNSIGMSLENAVNAIGNLFKEVAALTSEDRQLLYTRVQSLREFLVDPQTGALKVQFQGFSIESLVNRTSVDLVIGAANTLGYRYALVALNPFALLGPDSLYNTPVREGERPHNDGGSLAHFSAADRSGALTSQYITDRSDFLAIKNQAYVADLAGVIVPGQTDNWLYVDIPGRVEVTSLGGAPVSIHRKVVFGGDGAERVEGAGQADRLYGGAGTDYMVGQAGNDYQEGGRGLDLYRFAANERLTFNGFVLTNDGADEIRDIDGVGLLRYVYTPFLGGAQSAVVVDTSVKVNDNTWQSADGKFTFNRQDADLLVTVNVNSGGSLTLREFREGDFGIYLWSESNDPATGRTLEGDRRPEDGDPQTPGDQLVYDSWGNILTTTEIVQDRDDGLFGHDDSVGDLIIAGGGNDILLGDTPMMAVPGPRLGFDPLQSGGDDRLQGDSGRDFIDGGPGNDLAEGGMDGVAAGDAGGDVIQGGLGNDTLYGDSRIDIGVAIQQGETDTASTLKGDFVSGGAGDDRIIGSTARDVLMGGGGKDVLVGGAGDDNIRGDDGQTATTLTWTVSNTISIQDGQTVYLSSFTGTNVVDFSEGGADAVYAGQGNDWVFAEGGADFVEGGSGDDVLFGGFGSDIILGGIGSDVLVGDEGGPATSNEGGDYLDGGDGNDTIFGNGGDDILVGGREDDLLVGGASKDVYVYEKGDGRDRIDDSDMAGSAASVLYLGDGLVREDVKFGVGSLVIRFGAEEEIHFEGFDYVQPLNTPLVAELRFADGQVMTYADILAQGFDIDGTEEADDNHDAAHPQLTGTGVTDRIRGFGGNDMLAGIGGDDILDGGAGDDLIDGGVGNDYIAGGLGIDQLQGADGDDSLDGGEDADTLFGQVGADVLIGGAGNDQLVGGAQADTLDGGDGDDSLFGDAEDVATADQGADTLAGGAGNDTMRGYGGDDVLTGGEGNDVLFGEDGMDSLAGGAGTDELNGGFGNDTYLYASGDGQDDIFDQDATPGNFDRVIFGAGITPDDVTASRDASDTLFLQVGASGDVLTIANFYIGGEHVVESIEFADGTLWNPSSIPLLIRGTTANNSLAGTVGADTFEGLAGNDTLTGGAGNDTYRFFRGDGADRVTDTDSTAGNADRVVYAADILPSQILTTRSANDLVLSLSGTADRVTVTNYFENDGSTPSSVELIKFMVDGTTWDVEFVKLKLITGTAGDDNLTGYASSDVISGLEGNDLITGNGGDDVLDGGAGRDDLRGGSGNDILIGGAVTGTGQFDILRGGVGDDTYVFARASGEAHIDEENISVPTGGFDTILVSADIAPSEVRLRRITLENIELSLGDGSRLVVDRQYNTSGGLVEPIEQIRFAFDDTTWDLATIQSVVGTPTAGDDYVWGTSGNDVLDGLAGDDILHGLAGNDTYLFGTGGGADWIDDSASIFVLNNSDTVRFGAGIAPGDITVSKFVGLFNRHDLRLTYGAGDSVVVSQYFHQNSGTAIDLFQFEDGTVWTDETIAAMLPIVGSGGNDNISGYWNADVIFGGWGNDSILSNAGNDVLYGELGNDTLWGWYGQDEMYGGEGDDLLIGSEDLTFLNFPDLMAGGIGDDTYERVAVTDELIENVDEGVDTVRTKFSWSLGANLENLVLLESANVNGTGNELSNSITGNSGNNTLAGNDGADMLDGVGGSDLLIGGSGNDTYRFGIGNGSDTIEDSDVTPGNLDKVVMATGITPAQVTGSHTSTHRMLSLNGQDQLFIRWDPAGGYQVEQVEFTDGTVWDLATIIAKTNSAPTVVEPIADKSATQNQPFNLTVPTSTFSDADADALTYSANLADGSALPGWLTFDAETRTFSGIPTTPDAGLFSVRVTATDGDGALAGDVFDLTVEVATNNPPIVANAIADRLATEDELLSFAIPANTFSDPDAGDTLTYGASQTDGTPLPTWLTFDAETRTFSGTPPDTAAGLFAIRVTATDSGNASAFDDFVLDIANVVEGTAFADLLNGTALRDVIYGLDDHDELYGGLNDDVLYGGEGKDSLDGGPGADTLYGGNDLDNYYVDNEGDRVFEDADGGSDDYVLSELSWTLGDFIEGLVLVGASDLDGNGNALNNEMLGNGGRNTLSGGDGNDRIYGREGDDVIVGGAGNDELFGEAGFDILIGGVGDDIYFYPGTDQIIENENEGTDWVVSDISWTLVGSHVELVGLQGTANIDATGNDSDNELFGNAGNNILTGGAGDDFLTGRGGTDVLIGGVGNDSYQVLGTDDSVQIVESADEGIDTVTSWRSWTLGVNLENLVLAGLAGIFGTGNALDNILTGNSANNTLTGNAGNDWLDGGGGSDTLGGGTGNDSYVVDSSGDVVTEGSSAGTDTVHSSITYTLSSNLENLTLTGTAAVSATGNSANNILNGATNSAANTLTGGAGDDTYVVDALDTVVEASNKGTDTVQAGFSYTLGSNLENLTLIGAAAINGTGNAVANVLTGNSAANVLNGAAGSDTMAGGQGDDTYVVDVVGDVVTENTDEGTDTVQSAIAYTLGANVENLTLTGTASIAGTGNALNNVLVGNSGANSLSAGAGNDTLDGAAGADTLAGGAGDDSYVVDNAGDIVNESFNEGTDSVQSSVTHTLRIHVEHLTLTGAGAINGTGNDSNNVLIGNSAANTLTGGLGNDTLDGGAGVDTMAGGWGDDSYFVDVSGDVVTETMNQGADTVFSAAGYTLSADVENLTLLGTAAIGGTGNALNNLLLGNSGANTLTGGAGNDTLNGGAGADTMIGGTGNDTYVLDAAGDTVTENAGEGTDIVQTPFTHTLGLNVEDLVLTGTDAVDGTGTDANNSLTGNSAVNILTGGAGNDSLDGGAGADTMIGGLGNDGYDVDDVNDVIVENVGEGYDSVSVHIDYVLPDNFEDLVLEGETVVYATGNAMDNVLQGNFMNNVLDGGAGADEMFGWWGDDTYMVDNAGDEVTEAVGEGMDTVKSSVSYSIQFAAVEVLELTGTATIDGTANNLDNGLIGNDAANVLSGLGGADTLDGRGGSDTLVGGTGNDTYLLGRGYGGETIQENDATSGNTDVARFLADVAPEQIWFQQSGNDLLVSIIGTPDQFTVQNWYAGSQYRVEQFRTEDSQTLLESQVQNLVDAMAAFAPPAPGQTDLPPEYATQLNPTIAANWQ